MQRLAQFLAAVLALLCATVALAQVEAWDVLRRATAEEVRQALEEGLDVSMRGEEDETALHYAMLVPRDAGVVNALLEKGIDINARDASGATALHMAVRVDPDSAVAQALLEAGAEVNAQTKTGETPLLTVLTYLRHRPQEVEATVALLLEAGADPTLADEFGDTALHRALRPLGDGSVSRELVQALLNAGADANAQASGSVTPLMLAAIGAGRSLDPYIVVMLLEAGADATVIDEVGNAALDYARQNFELFGTGIYWMLHRATRGDFDPAPGTP